MGVVGIFLGGVPCPVWIGGLMFWVGVGMMVGMYTGKIGEWLGGFFVRDGGRGGLSGGGGGGGGGGVTIFIDESGDLGFGRGSSGWFVVGGVVTGDGLELVVRRVVRGFGAKGNRKRGGRMLHAKGETDGTRRRLLRGIGGYGGRGVQRLWWRNRGYRINCRGMRMDCIGIVWGGWLIRLLLSTVIGGCG